MLIAALNGSPRRSGNTILLLERALEGARSKGAETVMIDIRVSEVAAPAEGDTIEVNGMVYVIQGEPIRDVERLVWTIEVRPA